MDEEEALTSSGMTGFKSKPFTINLNQDQQKTKQDFSILPQFPHLLNFNSLFGRFTNVIPEETEDAVCSTDQHSKSKEDTSPSSNGDSIVHKVQNLGITAQSNTEKNLFEPYWIQTEPKAVLDHKGHVRRHSSGLIKSHMAKHKHDVTGVLDDSAFKNPDISHTDGFELKGSDNDKDNYLVHNQMHFDEMTMIPIDTITNTALDNAAFALNIRGNIFRKPSEIDDLSRSPKPRRRGDVFRENTGMRKSSSTSSLLRLENETQKLEFAKSQDIETLDTSFDGSEMRRRTSSTGNLRQLQSLKTLNKDVQQSDDQIKIESQSQNGAMVKTEPKKTTFVIGDSLDSMVKDTVNWATTKKVNRNKREHQYFSPTSF